VRAAGRDRSTCLAQVYALIAIATINGVMPASRRSLANLKRGGQSPETVRKAREAQARHRAEDRRIADVVRESPQAALAALHADLVLGVRRLTRKWLSSRSEPSRDLTAAWVELRRLTVELTALRRLENHSEEEAREFFDTLEKRIRAIDPRVFQLAQPLVEPE
jgi:hypothetical protein